MSEERRGILMGVAAYSVWGFLPLYWPLLKPAGAVEILSHRVVWSLVFVGLLLVRARALGKLKTIGAKRLRMLGVAAAFIAVNWGIYIWAVNHGHVVETALGYFINPLVTMLLGVVVLRESLRRLQWIAIGIAAVAVTMLTIDYGRPPWIALALAASFASYGLVKKRAGVGALEGLAVETAVLVVPAIGYLVLLGASGHGTFGHAPWKSSALLLSSGVVTALPLLAFAGSANRIPLSLMGPLQYISPTLQFLCGVIILHEAMPASRWLGFMMVWAALTLFVIDGIRRQSQLARIARISTAATADEQAASKG